MKKLNLFVFATIVSLCGCLMVNAQNTVEPYFTTSELPNLIKCLPAPPDTMSEHFVHDIMRYIWGKQQRLDEERAAIARRDAVWSYEALFQEFNEPFGLEISREGTPQIWKLLETSLVTTDQMRVLPKKYYNRMRPYVRFHEHILTDGQEEDEVELGKEGSYPSGHTARGWTCALLLAEINPANADTIFARGWMYGESRVIVGAHWQSDVDATRVAASIGYSRLQTSPAFRAQMALAQEEFRVLTGQSYVPSVIDTTNSYQGDGVVYNIMGQRVDEHYNGIVIEDGKKSIQIHP